MNTINKFKKIIILIQFTFIIFLIFPQKVVALEKPKRSKLSKETIDFVKKIRTEIKSTLSSGYSGQASFRSEWSRYTTNLKAMGFLPTQTKLTYKVGFIKAYDGRIIDKNEILNNQNEQDFLTTDGFVKNKISSESSDRKIPYNYSAEAEKVDLSAYQHLCEKGCTANENEFEMMMVFPIPNTDRAEVWTIKNNKEIKQLIDALFETNSL